MITPTGSQGPFPAGESLAFCLRLRAGCEDEYRRRHDALWPEIRQGLLAAGVLHYEIFLEPDSLLLFAFMVRSADHTMDQLRAQPVWQRWQEHMADILVQQDGLALRMALQPMFCLRKNLLRL